MSATTARDRTLTDWQAMMAATAQQINTSLIALDRMAQLRGAASGKNYHEPMQRIRMACANAIADLAHVPDDLQQAQITGEVAVERNGRQRGERIRARKRANDEEFVAPVKATEGVLPEETE